MIDPVALKAWPFADIVHHYTADDAMRYALALGVGSDPTDARQLKFVNDTTVGAPLSLPTLAVVVKTTLWVIKSTVCRWWQAIAGRGTT